MKKLKSVVVVDYRGLKVEEANELRKNFREAGVEYKIYKNNLSSSLAIEGTEYEVLGKDLTGPNAIAFQLRRSLWLQLKIVKEFAKDSQRILN